MPVPALPLTTERLLLRPYRSEDFDGTLDMFGRAEVARYLNWDVMDAAAARALVDRRLTQTQLEKEGEGFALAVEDRTTGRYAGEVILVFISERDRHGEVGWSIHPDFHGRGIATEAAGEMLRVGFESMDFHRISAECDPRNVASERVMAKLGMRREALHLEAMFVKGEWCDSLVCAILAAEWRGQRGEPPT